MTSFLEFNNCYILSSKSPRSRINYNLKEALSIRNEVNEPIENNLPIIG